MQIILSVTIEGIAICYFEIAINGILQYAEKSLLTFFSLQSCLKICCKKNSSFKNEHKFLKILWNVYCHLKRTPSLAELLNLSSDLLFYSPRPISVKGSLFFQARPWRQPELLLSHQRSLCPHALLAVPAAPSASRALLGSCCCPARPPCLSTPSSG